MQQDFLEEAPSHKIHKELLIYIAAFLGGPLAGGYLMAENFRSFGKTTASQTTIALAVLVTIVVIIISVTVGAHNIPGLLFPVAYALLAAGLTRKFQGQHINEHIAKGGKFFSAWRAVAITIVAAIVTLGIMIGMLWMKSPALWK